MYVYCVWVRVWATVCFKAQKFRTNWPAIFESTTFQFEPPNTNRGARLQLRA